MLRTWIVAISVLVPTAVPASAPLPAGWKVGGTSPDSYTVAVDHTYFREGSSSARLTSISEKPPGYVTLVQSVNAESFRGTRVRFEAQVRSDRVENRSALWFRVEDAAGRVLAFDGMKERPVKGSQEWQEHALVLDVPEDAAVLIYGAVLDGVGSIWVDEAALQTVGSNVLTTGESEVVQANKPKNVAQLALAPVNLGFEP